MALLLDVPPDIEKRFTHRDALESFLLGAYQSEILSRAEVGKILGLSFWGTESFFKEHDVYRLYGQADLDDDLEALRRVLP